MNFYRCTSMRNCLDHCNIIETVLNVFFLMDANIVYLGCKELVMPQRIHHGDTMIVSYIVQMKNM